MPLRAADAPELVQVQDLHRGSARRRARASSAIGPVAKRARTSAAPAARAARAAPGRARARRAAARARRCRRRRAGSRSRPPTTVAVPPALVATTGRPAASDSIATTGVPSFARSAARRRRPRTTPGCAAGSRRSGSGRRRRARARALGLAAVLAVADEHEHASTPGSSTARSVRTRSSGRLIAVSRPAQPIDERLVAEAELGPHLRARAPSSAAPQSGRSKPYGTTAKRSAGATPKPHEVVAHLVADRDERAGGCASSRSIRRKTRSQRRPK